MRKTTVYLPQDLKDQLVGAAGSAGSSQAEVVRQALRKAISPSTKTVVFALAPGPVRDGVRRVVYDQIDAACAELGGETDDSRDVAVHEARKRFKRIRAALRLVRDEVGETVYAEENVAYRDIGRSLAGIRDARVLVDTLAALDGGAYAGVRASLTERAADAEQRAGEAADRALEQLSAARARVAAWPIDRDGFVALEGGLVRVYRQGRRRRSAAYEQPEGERFHEWRKRVKDLWHVFQLLEPSWPPVLTALAKEAHELSDLLGDEHDLWVLAETVEADRLGTARERTRLVDRAAHRREELRAHAHLLGARIYAEKPTDFTDRMAAYFEAWQGP